MEAMWSNDSVMLGPNLAYAMRNMYSREGVEHRTTEVHSGGHSKTYNRLFGQPHLKEDAHKSSYLIAIPPDMSVWQSDIGLTADEKNSPANSIYVAFKGNQVLFVAGRSCSSQESDGALSLFEFDKNGPARYALAGNVAEKWPDTIPVDGQQRMHIDKLVQQLKDEGHSAKAGNLGLCLSYLTSSRVGQLN